MSFVSSSQSEFVSPVPMRGIGSERNPFFLASPRRSIPKLIHDPVPQGESFLGRKWLIGKKIKKELDKPEGISHTKMV